MNNLKNNIRRTPRQLARREPARSCEPSSHELSSQLSSLFPYRRSVTDGDTTRTYTYHADGQLASANYVNNGRAGAPRTPQSEDFLWDGLALIQRGGESFVNEPHVGGGNPVASSSGTTYFNDMLGTTVGSKSNGKYSAAALTAFGEDLSVNSSGESSRSPFPVPHGLGHAFLMRNYRAGLAKWQTADPLGYPDGWNQLAYCRNNSPESFDFAGGSTFKSWYSESDWYPINSETVVVSDTMARFTAEEMAIITERSGGSLRFYSNGFSYGESVLYSEDHKKEELVTASWGQDIYVFHWREHEINSYSLEITVDYINKARNNEIGDASSVMSIIGRLLSLCPNPYAKISGVVLGDGSTIAGFFATVDNRLHDDEVLVFGLGEKHVFTDREELTQIRTWAYYE